MAHVVRQLPSTLGRLGVNRRDNFHLSSVWMHPKVGIVKKKQLNVTRMMASTNEGPESQKVSLLPRQMSHFCRKCGGSIEMAIPKGDDKERHVCMKCGYVDYFNPKMVVGCIVEHDKKILLCKRGIEPCHGLWTLPAGFLEMNESTTAGAARETREEANADVEIQGPYTHLDIPAISQTYILFRARLRPPFEYSPGPETIEAKFFRVDEIPFDELAFSSVAITLRHYIEDMEKGFFRIHHGIIVKAPGAPFNDHTSYSLENHFAIPTNARSTV